jgi:predicted secreted protein
MRYPKGNLTLTSRYRKAAIILVVWVFAFGAIGISAGKTVKRAGGHSNQPVRLATGDTLEVTLDGNPTTGYMWEMSSGATILKQVGEPAFKPSRKLPGSGGKVTFRFVAGAPGRTVLEMSYHRSFEKDVPPLKTFKLTVEVK